MLRIFWTFLTLVIILSSCVPNKRIVYLQHDVEPKVSTVTNEDSLARIYNTRLKEYLLKPRDIISLRVGTLTPTEFDFIQKYEEDLGILRRLNQYDQANMAGGTNMRMGMGGGGGGGGGGGSGGGGMSSITLDRLQTGFVIDDDGNLALPKIGKVTLQGLNLIQAENLIREKLTGFFETPVVRIQLLSFHFTIFGEVSKEGRYTIFDPGANIFDAISIASNLTDFADRSKIKVVRFVGEKATVLYVNLLKENLLEQPGFYLQPNDLIIVPPLKARFTKKYAVPNITTTFTLVLTALSLILVVQSLNTK